MVDEGKLVERDWIKTKDEEERRKVVSARGHS